LEHDEGRPEPPYFPVFREDCEVFEQMDDESLLMLFRAMIRYWRDGEYPDSDILSDGQVKLVFPGIRRKLDLSIEKYRRTCDRNRANAAKRGESEPTESAR